MSVLSANNLAITKQDRLLFEALSFEVKQGELLYVKGPNGAGKTSLLRVLVGLADPSEGTVNYDGHSIRTCRDDYHQNLLYFGHKLGLSGALNAVENLNFWCQLHGLNVAQKHIFHILEGLGLVGLETVPVNQLSAGQQRRVSLARFWLKTDARLWVMDEPLTALDVDGVSLLEERIAQHLTQGGSTIITSHQPLSIAAETRELTLEYLW